MFTGEYAAPPLKIYISIGIDPEDRGVAVQSHFRSCFETVFSMNPSHVLPELEQIPVGSLNGSRWTVERFIEECPRSAGQGPPY